MLPMPAQPHWKTRLARINRRDATNAEFLLWQELRGSALGVRFRRQDPVGPYIADFSCRSHRLIIETDGNSHIDPIPDRERDSWFNDHGWFVIRFDDNDVLDELDQTIDLIIQALEDPTTITNPLKLPD
jgi:BirA family biotin operon repressor/biotin-[acetyl-CoA-carboxylase] ligase